MTDSPELRPTLDHLSKLIPTVVADDDADPELVGIGERYWALAGFAEQDGIPVWCEKTTDIDTVGWGRQIYAVAAAGVRAIVPGRHCPKCEGPLSLTSRTAFQQVCDGHDPVCVRCTDSLLAAVRIVLDPARKAKREEAKIAAKTQRAVDEASARWRRSQREIIQETYGVVSPGKVSELPIASIREMVGALALLRYAPSTSPIAAISGWPSPLYPDSGKIASLLGSVVRAGLVEIDPSSPVTAFEWAPAAFEDALREAAGDLQSVTPPRLTSNFYPLSACYCAPHGTSQGTATEQLDAHLTAALNPAGMMAGRHDDLLAVARELIAEEALRYFANRLEELHLPGVPDNHCARLSEAAYKLAEHRPLGEIYNLVWRATRAAAEAAQKNPRAPRAHMSTHAVNQMESHAQKAAAEPDWQLKPFSEIKGHGLTAMTRTLFYNVLNTNPILTSFRQIATTLPEPAPDEAAPETSWPQDDVEPDELEVWIRWLNSYSEAWDPEDVSTALKAVEEDPEDSTPEWQFEGRVLARGAAQLLLLYTRLVPALGSRQAALAVMASTALLNHPVTLSGQSVTSGEWLLHLIRALILQNSEEDSEESIDGTDEHK